MEVFKVDISSWTASFRYPNLISGVQPTLEVPPISTVLGLLNAAAGKYLIHSNLEIGYFFQYAAKEFDLETIYQISTNTKGYPTNNAKSNVIKRQFLFENKLSIYLKDSSIVSYLRQPYYNMLLGRSNDLATIEKIENIKLLKQENAKKIKGQIIPLHANFLPGKIQALPLYFSNTIPRKNLGTEPYSIINFKAEDTKTTLLAYRDKAQGNDGVDIFFHKINSTQYE